MQEIFDVLNKDGTFTGIKKTRDEIHKSGDWHRVACVWVINSKKEVLIQLRSSLKSNSPNMWNVSCAGHISAGEDGKTGAIREVKEELGLDIGPDELIYLGESIEKDDADENATYKDNEIHACFLVIKDINTNDFSLQKEEVAEVKWVNYLDLKKDLVENQTKYVGHRDLYNALFSYIENTTFPKS